MRAALAATPGTGIVLAAVSGGADSLALLAALAWEGPRQQRAVGVVHVDHALQPGSAAQGERVAAQARRLGVTDVRIERAKPAARPTAGHEADARLARYDVLDAVARAGDVDAVFLGHTRDDQAEQVLLGLARGSGARSLAGMPAVRGAYRRPLLGLTHESLVSACREQGLDVWEDPSNQDLRLLRNRVRHRVLPLLEAELGPGIADALVRSADLLRSDADLLDTLAAAAYDECAGSGNEPGLSVPALAALPDALRTRVIRREVLSAGAPASAVSRRHVRAAESLVVRWRGQGPVSLPGGLVAVRRCDRLVVEAP
ncbi:MAG TPA: tRNA lysidine(34) synthetase TilS [Mycobacteriales bacterium]|nr:tRNA lysidine(34) synthetase TilS [Mycobacteriales bacterium]